MNRNQYENTRDYKKALKILKGFVDEELDGDIDAMRTFCFDNLTKFIGNIGDPDMYLIVQAIYIILWGDIYDLTFEKMGAWDLKGTYAFRGDTINSFGSLFGKESKENEFGYRAKFFGADKDIILWNKIKEFSRLYHQIGNFIVIPNRSNMDYPVNIHQIYEHLFNGQELDDNKKRGKLDTIRKNIVGLHTNGLIEMDTEFSENTGKRERYKKEDDDVAIWYEQKLDTRYALILIQKIMEMNNLSLNDKKNLVQAICDCAGSKIMESASYAQNVIKSNPLYDLTEKNGVKDSILFEGQQRYKAGNREIPDIWIEECDIPKMPSMAKTEMKKIGFAISA